MAAPLVRIPERQVSRVEFARLEIEPRAHLVGEIGRFEVGPLARDSDFPAEARSEREQQRECGQRPQSSSAGSRWGESAWKIASAIRYAQPPKMKSGR